MLSPRGQNSNKKNRRNGHLLFLSSNKRDVNIHFSLPDLSIEMLNFIHLVTFNDLDQHVYLVNI